METNLEQQSPKLNVTNVSSAVFGKEGSALGKESNIGKLSRILRTTRLKVNEVEKIIGKQENNIVINAEKITRLKNILQNQKSNIGEKLPGSTEEKEKAKLNTTLTETNRILVEIQKQLAYDFAMRVAEDKQEVAEDKEATSKKRFKREESALEKSAKSMVSTVKTATKKIVSPIGNIFDKLIAFIGILGKGIALNAAFEFFKNEENRKKITKFFNILKENWQLLAKILGVIGGAILLGKIIGFIGAMTKFGGFILGLAANPLFLAGIGIIMAAAMQGMGPQEKELLKELEDMGGVNEDNRKKLIQNYKNYKKDYKNNPSKFPLITIKNLTGEVDREVDERIRFLETGEFDYGGEKMTFDFKFGDFLTITQGGKYNYNTGEEESTSPDGSKPGIDFFKEKRAMGGPVTAGKTYLVGERGPELVKFSENGQVINNMQTEKVYQMLSSGKRGRTRIVELPPQTIEGPKPEINVSRGPATKPPTISSFNSLDGARLSTSSIYGIETIG